MISEQFLSELVGKGFAIIDGMFDDEFISRIKSELEKAIEREASFHNTHNYKEYGMLLACPLYGGAFLDLLEKHEFIQPFNWVLGETCIVYVYTSSSMAPHSTNNSNRIHVDRPMLMPGYIESLACLVLLDDFNEQNGATYFLPASQNDANQPDEKYFYENAKRLIAKKGSVFYFNPRLWHAGGVNNTNEWRHSVGMAMIKPYLKQRLDLPRMMKEMELTHVSENVLQKLGFFAQAPASLEEYYAPPGKRPYRLYSEWNKKL